MKHLNVVLFSAILSSLVVSSGCVRTRSAPVQDQSGFLKGYYQLLKEGGDNRAQLVYVNPRAKFSNYSKIYLAPVEILRTQHSGMGGYSIEELKRISAKTYAIFSSVLSTDFSLVNRKGPGTLVVALAITDADKSEPLLDAVTSVVPFGLAASTIKLGITSKPSFVGEASGEGKISDGVTGEVLMAGMDRRVGGKMISSDPTNSWADFESIIKLWAERLRFNLCKAQSRTQCEAP